MNWVQRKIYLYNVTFGLYMLDWWERYLFNSGILKGLLASSWALCLSSTLVRCFGDSLDVVRHVQRYTLLFRALQEAFDMKTGLVSRTVEHEKRGTSKDRLVWFQFMRCIPTKPLCCFTSLVGITPDFNFPPKALGLFVCLSVSFVLNFMELTELIYRRRKFFCHISKSLRDT